MQSKENAMPKKKKIENKLSTFTSVILGIFADAPFRPKNYKQVCKIMGIKDLAGKDVVYNLLIDLKNKGLLREERPFSYVMSAAGMAQFGAKAKCVEGSVELKSTGKACVILDDEEGEDIFIAANNTYKALHGDRVRVEMFPKRNNAKPEGEIVEILGHEKDDQTGDKTQKVYNLIILDESGSMQAIAKQAVSGLNETFQTICNAQKEHQEQKHFISFVTFNSKEIRTIMNRQAVECDKEMKY